MSSDDAILIDDFCLHAWHGRTMDRVRGQAGAQMNLNFDRIFFLLLMDRIVAYKFPRL